MAQLRHDYEKFASQNTEIIVIVPNGPFLIRHYHNSTPVPYLILSDKGSAVAKQYFQVRKFLIIGSPMVFLVQKGGKIVYTHYANSVIEEPDNKEPLAILEKRHPRIRKEEIS